MGVNSNRPCLSGWQTCAMSLANVSLQHPRTVQQTEQLVGSSQPNSLTGNARCIQHKATDLHPSGCDVHAALLVCPGGWCV